MQNTWRDVAPLSHAPGMVPLKELSVVASERDRLGSTGFDDGIAVEVGLSGNAEVPDRLELTNLLGRLDRYVVSNGRKLVRVNLTDLKFMTSSCFKDFVTWLTEIQKRSTRYKVHFIINPKTRWQRTSIHALWAFAVDVVSFE